MQPKVDYLTHYYKKGTPPFRSLSALPKGEALGIMEALCYWAFRWISYPLDNGFPENHQFLDSANPN